MKKFYPFLVLFLLPAMASLSQQPQTITLYPYDTSGASGYVDPLDTNFSGDLVSIGNTVNKGFIIFNASMIPAGAQIKTAEVVMHVNGSGTSLISTGFGTLNYIPVNTIYGSVKYKEIPKGEVYADKFEWGDASIIGPMTSPLNDAGIAALQKKIGTAFSVGVNPPTTNGNTRTIKGYNSTTVNAPKPEMRVTYLTGSAPKPSADFTTNVRDTFLTSEINFYDNSGNYPTSWFWEFGDDSTSILKNPTHTYADTGYYSVKLSAKNAQGEDVMAKQNFIHIAPVPPPPIADFSVSTRSPAEGEEVTFTDRSVGYISNRKWYFGDSETSSEKNPGYTYASPGVYSVKLIVSGPFGSDTINKKNFINAGGEVLVPVADFTFDNTKGLTVLFTDVSANFPDQWLWDFGDGNTADVQNPSHAYATAGTYTVCLETTNLTGSDTVCKKVGALVTSVTEFSEAMDDLKLYPNPFTEEFYVERAHGHSQAVTAGIYNSLGKLISLQAVQLGTTRISTVGEPRGIYFVQLLDRTKTTTALMIKQ